MQVGNQRAKAGTGLFCFVPSQLLAGRGPPPPPSTPASAGLHEVLADYFPSRTQRVSALCVVLSVVGLSREICLLKKMKIYI